ncbi:hypothetical protein C1646_675052 [Rhizophagus diaphanus]|nr:hypothetical protein C1646_675052 [Rhizophagus diaphanus] [Rhizophagus sp. MUCL 43196]
MTRAIKKACSNESNEDLIKKYEKVLNDVQDTLTITISKGQTPTANELLIKGGSKKPTNSSILCINHLIKTCGLMDEVRKIEGTSKRTMQITRRLGGILWKRMDCHDPNKLFFNKLAQELKEIHKLKFPYYKQTTRKSTLRQYRFKHVNEIITDDHIHIMNDHQMIQPNITNINIAPQYFLPQPQQFSPQLTQQYFSHLSPYQYEILYFSDVNNL